jgi:hypothetical protein
MDLLIENARMAESAMRRFEEIDQLIRGEIDLREASIAEVHTLVCRVADSLHSLLDIKSQSVLASAAAPVPLEVEVSVEFACVCVVLMVVVPCFVCPFRSD